MQFEWMRDKDHFRDIILSSFILLYAMREAPKRAHGSEAGEGCMQISMAGVGGISPLIISVSLLLLLLHTESKENSSSIA